MRKVSRSYLFCYAQLSLIAGAVVLLGCGDGGMKTIPVKGKVTMNGQPVKGGSLSFSPVGSGEVGKPGGANVGEDGTYVVGTYTETDGAVPGKHRISYSPPQSTVELKPGESVPESEYSGTVPKPEEIEVKAGMGPVDIELVKPGA